MLQPDQELKLKRLSAILEKFENETDSDFSGAVSLSEDTSFLCQDERHELDRPTELRLAALSKVSGSSFQHMDL